LSEITHTDLVAAVHGALENVAADDGFALTTKELCAALNISTPIAYKMLARLVRAGTVECVKVRRTNITGAPQRVAAYRVKAITSGVVK
jgi:Mn-dependent DtxR family transcriptional regulator